MKAEGEVGTRNHVPSRARVCTGAWVLERAGVEAVYVFRGRCEGADRR